MRSQIRFFLFVGLIATGIDLGLLYFLREIGLFPADLIALSAAALTSFVLNKYLTFSGDRNARWVSSPGLFALTALLAGITDLLVLMFLDSQNVGTLIAKSIAIVVAAIIRWLFYRRILFTVVRRELEQKSPRQDPGGSLRLSIVIPAYNEGVRIEKTIAALHSALTDIGDSNYEIVVVDDGSDDDTAKRAARKGANVIEQPANKGKGAAVRAGVLASTGKTVVFTDADLAYSPGLIIDVLDEVENGWDVVVGNRRHKSTKTSTQAKRIRQFGGWVINRLTHIVLLGHFRDTQCGLKGFRGDIGRTIFDRTRVDGFGFDVEIFLIAEQDSLSLLEIPVLLENRAGSSVGLIGDTFVLLRDLFRIRRWAGKGLYAPSEDHKAVLESGSADIAR